MYRFLLIIFVSFNSFALQEEILSCLLLNTQKQGVTKPIDHNYSETLYQYTDSKGVIRPLRLPDHIQTRFQENLNEFNQFSKDLKDLITSNLELIYGNVPKNFNDQDILSLSSEANKLLFENKDSNPQVIKFIEKIMNNKTKDEFFKNNNKEVFF